MYKKYKLPKIEFDNFCFYLKSWLWKLYKTNIGCKFKCLQSLFLFWNFWNCNRKVELIIHEKYIFKWRHLNANIFTPLFNEERLKKVKLNLSGEVCNYWTSNKFPFYWPIHLLSVNATRVDTSSRILDCLKIMIAFSWTKNYIIWR